MTNNTLSKPISCDTNPTIKYMYMTSMLAVIERIKKKINVLLAQNTVGIIGKKIFVIKKTKQYSDQIYFDTNVIRQGKN